jgi:hypothetical protein
MQPQQLFAGHGEQAERVVVAQVGLEREREARAVGQRLQVVGLDAGLVELAPHVRHVRIGVLQRVPEPPRLQPGERVARHRLGGAIEHEDVGCACSGLRAHALSSALS